MQEHPYLNLDRYRETLGDPSKYFVDDQLPTPRVVEHATGQVRHVIDRKGRLRDPAELATATGDRPRACHLGYRYEFDTEARAEASAKPGLDARAEAGETRLAVSVTHKG